jgi:hypothetical protein
MAVLASGLSIMILSPPGIGVAAGRLSAGVAVGAAEALGLAAAVAGVLAEGVWLGRMKTVD